MPEQMPVSLSILNIKLVRSSMRWALDQFSSCLKKLLPALPYPFQSRLLLCGSPTSAQRSGEAERLRWFSSHKISPVGVSICTRRSISSLKNSTRTALSVSSAGKFSIHHRARGTYRGGNPYHSGHTEYQSTAGSHRPGPFPFPSGAK